MAGDSRAKVKDWFSRNWVYLVWGGVALIFGLSGLFGIFAFAGIAIVPPSWCLIRVPVLEGSARGHVVTAAVTWFGGTVALYTYFLNRDQKERHLNAQLEETRKIEGERERRERDLAELQRLEAEFAALADDFAQDAPLARINAAIGFGEIAFKPDPRRVDVKGELMPDPRPPITWSTGNDDYEEHEMVWREEWRSLKAERNYPYFLRAAHRLAAALHQWEDEAPRAQAQRVLKEMAEWAKDEGTDEPLLHALVNALAEANRTAWALLRDQVAKCLAADLEQDVLLPLLGVGNCPFPFMDEAQWAIARKSFHSDLVDELVGSSAYLAFQAAREAVPEDKREQQGKLEERLRAVGQGLWATRDALATALRTLSPPPDLPKSPAFPMRGADETWEAWQPRQEAWQKALDEWQKKTAAVRARRSLNLQSVRLLGAYCFPAHFEGAICLGARFEGANCWGAHFEGASCLRAHFEGANCLGARFEGASCLEAHFAGANCFKAHFEGADCSGAHFEGANCDWAHFEGANCFKAHFEGANCFKAHFEGAACSLARFEGAHIAGAKMGQGGGTATHFAGREWESADFDFARFDEESETWVSTGERDTQLYNFLNERYPPPAESAEPAHLPTEAEEQRSEDEPLHGTPASVDPQPDDESEDFGPGRNVKRGSTRPPHSGHNGNH